MIAARVELGNTRLREARRRAGLTQQQLAHLAATTELVISRLETGRCAATREVQERIANVLGKQRFEVFAD